MPGTLIREKTARVPRTAPADTGVYFLAGLAAKGVPGVPVAVHSIGEFERYFGTRQTYSVAWDMVDAYFQRGGSVCVFSRVVGPAPVYATGTLLDGTSAISLNMTAVSPGQWANTLQVSVLAGDVAGEFKIQITDSSDASIYEVSPSLADQAAAILWSQGSDYIRFTLGVSTSDPAVVSNSALTGGTGDHTNATDDSWLAALNAFTKDLGPGQVGYAGRATSVAQGQLCDHAKNNNRAAVCDTVDTSSKATLISAAQAFRALTNAKYGAIFAPWVKIGPYPNSSAQRTVPPSCLVAGAIAANESAGMSPNQPSAGQRGLIDMAQGLNATFTDQDYTDLNDQNMNMLLIKYGEVRIYGWRSGATKFTNPNWWMFNNVRLYMAIAAKANLILEQFVLKEIDAQGNTFGDLSARLTAMLLPYWQAGSLYGTTQDDAFVVDTGPSVNTPTTIANSEIHAQIELAMSPMGENVILDIVKKSIS